MLVYNINTCYYNDYIILYILTQFISYQSLVAMEHPLGSGLAKRPDAGDPNEAAVEHLHLRGEVPGRFFFFG